MHGRGDILIDQVQLDLLAHEDRIGLEHVLMEHAGKDVERTRELPADPMQGVEAGAATAVVTEHLPHHNFRV